MLPISLDCNTKKNKRAHLKWHDGDIKEAEKGKEDGKKATKGQRGKRGGGRRKRATKKERERERKQATAAQRKKYTETSFNSLNKH